MSINRVQHKKDNYTIISNECLHNPDISARAKGVFAYLMTLPDDWVVRSRELLTHFTEGRDAIRTAIEELETHGYILRGKKRGDGGRMNGRIFNVYEEVQLRNEAADKSPANKPCAKNPYTVKPSLLRTDTRPSTDKRLSTEKDRIGEPIRSFSGDTEKEKETRKPEPASPGTAEADRETTQAVLDLLNSEGISQDIFALGGYSEKLKISLPWALDSIGKWDSEFQMTPDSRKAVSIIRDGLIARKLPADAQHITTVAVQAYLGDGRGHRMVEYIMSQKSGLTLRPFVAWDGFIDEVFASFENKDKVTELCKELLPPEEHVAPPDKEADVLRAATGDAVEV